jgi:hypothetical protein
MFVSRKELVYLLSSFWNSKITIKGEDYYIDIKLFFVEIFYLLAFIIL